MCDIDEQNRNKCFRFLDALPPIQEALTISKIIGTLYRFRYIQDNDSLSLDGEIKGRIRAHIAKYSKKERLQSVDAPDDAIGSICSFAEDLLIAGDICYDAIVFSNDVKSVVQRADFRFLQNWLANIKLMIPRTEKVTKILPFLLGLV